MSLVAFGAFLGRPITFKATSVPGGRNSRPGAHLCDPIGYEIPVLGETILPPELLVLARLSRGEIRENGLDIVLRNVITSSLDALQYR